VSNRTPKPERSSQEKLLLFRERITEKLARENTFGASIARAIGDQLDISIQSDMLLASLSDPMLYGHARTDLAQLIMKDTAREVWGPSTHFLMTAQNAAVANKRKAKKSHEHQTSVKPTSPPKSENLFGEDEVSVAPEKSSNSITDLLGNIENLSQYPSFKVQTPTTREEKDSPNVKLRSLNNDYTFQSFVTGIGNESARQACHNAAQKPGEYANPVLIYGSTGLGKTHLLHAVGNEIKRQRPQFNIRYVTSEDFYDGFSKIFRSKNKSSRVDLSKEEFKQKYRDVDVLLMDDIQLLEGKDATQVEFFHTFNDLFQAQKQIVLTSDKYPKDIPRMEERLKSRFVQGLIASVEPPSFEDRVAIIEVKCKTYGLKLAERQIELIATHVKDSVRDIEGVLNTLRAKRALEGSQPSDEAVKNEIRKHVKSGPAGLDVAAIQRAVANHFGIRLQEMLGNGRHQNLVLPRQIAMFLTRNMLDLTNMEIAGEYGRKDHTTVMHAIKKIQGLMSDDASTLETIRELRRKLEQGSY
jgi:chromosomal replication initiator protein